MCGEHSYWLAREISIFGSSPRVWGALASGVLAPRGPRLIPTCVGSTSQEPPVAPCESAHPHVCGEHRRAHYRLDYPTGSSPRVWGARTPMRVRRLSLWLIPTCVGSTHTHGATREMNTAHPHVCGEHFGLCEFLTTCVGSSPRVWGARYSTTVIASSLRLIPTCVGSTSKMGVPPVREPAHPHVCGEHSQISSKRIHMRGSSPRVWGALS